jgi:glycosyltransferase involved in cell wall biosynthesis
MAGRPEISVVMSVFNSASNLALTLDSVLNQQEVDLEFIVVNDGSSDGSAEILNDYATQDSRLRVFHQANVGLTQALIRGCAEARGEFIARQDAGGDISLPGRLAGQSALLRNAHDAVLVSCGTRFVAPQGETLFDIVPDAQQINAAFADARERFTRGLTHHGSTLFRRSAYERVGGYRMPFFFAQDLDLWFRLYELGRFAALPTVLYQAKVAPTTISGYYRDEQVALTELIRAATRLRRNGKSEDEVLQKALFVRPQSKVESSRARKAAALYFVGACLRARKDPRARGYFGQAIRTWPMHLKAWYRYLF